MLNRRQKRMKKMVAEFQKYVATYSNQMMYEDYSDATFINDMLYGIGITMNKKEYSYALGYDRWLKFLKENYINKGE